MSIPRPLRIHSAGAEQSDQLRSALDGIAAADGTQRVTIGESRIEAPAAAREAIVDLLERLAVGDSVVIASIQTLLTTSQAAEMIGISHTYLLRLADSGRMPVQYRGTHRRFAVADVVAYLERTATVTANRSAPQP